MNKYEWLWKTLKQHKSGLVEKFESKGKPVPIQHTSTLQVMEFLELKEPQENSRHVHQYPEEG